MLISQLICVPCLLLPYSLPSSMLCKELSACTSCRLCCQLPAFLWATPVLIRSVQFPPHTCTAVPVYRCRCNKLMACLFSTLSRHCQHACHAPCCQFSAGIWLVYLSRVIMCRPADLTT